MSLTPSQEINALANELAKMNQDLGWRDCMINAIITYLDIKASNTKEFIPTNVEKPKAVEPTPLLKEEKLDASKVHVMVRDGNAMLKLEINQDADIYEWARNLDIILQWLTFCPETIKEVLNAEEV